MDDRIARYLLGSDQIDGRLFEFVDPQAGATWSDMADEVKQRLNQWSSAWDHAWKDVSPVILFHGRYGSGRHAAASSLAQALGKPFLMLSMANLNLSDLRVDQIVKLAEREALLSGGLVCWDQIDELLQSDSENELFKERKAFIHSLAKGSTIVVLLTTKAWVPARDLRGRPFLQLEFPATNYAARKAAWAAQLNGSNPLSDEELDA